MEPSAPTFSVHIDGLSRHDAIRVVRAALGMTRRDVAAAWGVSMSTYDRTERGGRTVSAEQFEWLMLRAERADVVVARHGDA